MTTATRARQATRPGLLLLAALVAALTMLGLAAGSATAATQSGTQLASAAGASVAENRVGASTVAGRDLVGAADHVCAGQRLGGTAAEPVIASATGVAANTAKNGAATVRVGQAGEAAVRGAFDIGPKATVEVAGRTRILDGLNSEAVSEVKNVASQSFTLQLRDSLGYAQANGLRFDLYVRSDTYLTGPLQNAIVDGSINLRYIP